MSRRWSHGGFDSPRPHVNNEIMPFDFHGNQVRVVLFGGEPWWVVNDVCSVLEIANPHAVLERLDRDCLGQAEVTDALGRPRQTNVVNESGLYELIFRSDKPAARDFRRWVTAEVLPQIRKTGSYAVQAMTPEELLVVQAQRLLEQSRRVAVVESRQAELERRVDDVQQKTDWYTAIGFAKREGLPTNHEYLNRLGRAAGRITRAAGEEPAKVYNELWGEVNSYPEWALSEAAGGLA